MTNAARYRIEEELGRGAVGVVFRATRVADGRLVALKLLRPELAADSEYRARLAGEARMAMSVQHPRLVEVLEVGELDGRPYLATAFVDGPSLSSRLAADGPLPLDAAVRVTRDVAAGLDALHEAGLLHRDVKPGNVLLEPSGRALVADFGYARDRALTATTLPRRLIGTLDYLAPELLLGQPATKASDVYALGCVLHECLAGEPPFAHRGPLTVGRAHLEEQPMSLAELRGDVPKDVADVAGLALAKDPRERPPTAGTLARMLRLAVRTIAPDAPI